MEEGDDRPVIDVSSGVGGGGGVMRLSEAVTEGADADRSTERTTPRAPSTVCLTVFSTVDWKPRAPSWTVLKRSMPFFGERVTFAASKNFWWWAPGAAVYAPARLRSSSRFRLTTSRISYRSRVQMPYRATYFLNVGNWSLSMRMLWKSSACSVYTCVIRVQCAEYFLVTNLFGLSDTLEMSMAMSSPKKPFSPTLFSL